VDVLADGAGSSGVVGGTLKDATLRMLDANGTELMSDDNSGAGLDARMMITPNASGTYYFDVGANGAELGTYTLRLREMYSGVADPLQAAQWYLPALGLDKLGGQVSGAGVTVGMVDDGIDTAHPDLQGRINFALAYDAQFKTTDGNHKYPPLVGLPQMPTERLLLASLLANKTTRLALSALRPTRKSSRPESSGPWTRSPMRWAINTSSMSVTTVGVRSARSPTTSTARR
jgi:hypothetical protein